MAAAAQRKTKRRSRGRPFSGKDDPRRHPGFVPGQSGNPGGMSRDVAALRDEARRIAAELAPDAIVHLGEIVRMAKAKRTATAVSKQAADSILDRALGKASQPIDARVTEAHRWLIMLPPLDPDT